MPLVLVRAVLVCISAWSLCSVYAADVVAAEAEPAVPTADNRPLVSLGPGDSVTIQVYGQPDMTVTVYVSDDGTVPVPLAGAVRVAGLSPTDAALQIERALRVGNFLVDPHVTITVAQSRSQRVSILGQVRTPGRYPIESNTTLIDLLAEAGGATEDSSDAIFVIRTDPSGVVHRYSASIRGMTDTQNPLPTPTVQGGDSVFVPKADQIYVYGEVQKPDKYRLDKAMTVIQAIALAGGITPRGSDRRFELKRKDASGNYVILHPKPTDLLQADDVLRVKESIF